MRQYRFCIAHILRLSLLTVALLFVCSLQLTAIARQNVQSLPVSVHLVDEKGALIKNVVLAARHAGSNRIQSAGKEDKSGTAAMTLPPGRYYFTGDISMLNSRVPYFSHVRGNQPMMLYYISGPVDITDTTREITLTVNSANYVDVADIADVTGFNLYIEQAELGINTEVCVRDSTNGARLFLPMRKIYHFSTMPSVLSLKWPIYATPGLRVVLSAT